MTGESGRSISVSWDQASSVTCFLLLVTESQTAPADFYTFPACNDGHDLADEIGISPNYFSVQDELKIWTFRTKVHITFSSSYIIQMNQVRQGVVLFHDDNWVTCARLCVCVCVCLSVCICATISLIRSIPENRPIPSHSIKDWGVSYLCYFFYDLLWECPATVASLPSVLMQKDDDAHFNISRLYAVTKTGPKIEHWGIPKLLKSFTNCVWSFNKWQSSFLYNNNRRGYKTVITLDVLKTILYILVIYINV